MYVHNSNSETSRCDPQDHHYGRRVEADRTWTVYHVFTGVPADAGCGAMTGLSRADATDRMVSLNRYAAALHRRTRVWLKPPAIDATA